MDDDGLLAEQRAYYRARAPEYDEWWQRRGRFDRGTDLAEEWDRQVAQVDAALEAFGATGDVLEMAGGTGWWTERLARTARHLTVIDSSPEALDLNRDRVGRPDVDYLVADLFLWQPERTYDVVFFSFWLSHVPRSRFSIFWSLVRSCLAPGGRVFLVDNRYDRHPTGEIKDSYVVQHGPDLELRRLHDGSRYQVVEVYYEPDDLHSLLGRQGWTARLEATPWFIFGEASLAETHKPHGSDVPQLGTSDSGARLHRSGALVNPTRHTSLKSEEPPRRNARNLQDPSRRIRGWQRVRVIELEPGDA